MLGLQRDPGARHERPPVEVVGRVQRLEPRLGGPHSQHAPGAGVVQLSGETARVPVPASIPVQHEVLVVPGLHRPPPPEVEPGPGHRGELAGRHRVRVHGVKRPAAIRNSCPSALPLSAPARFQYRWEVGLSTVGASVTAR
ncbi:hypothetical protein SMICM17S_03002 [Streptomyces microflavus]